MIEFFNLWINNSDVYLRKIKLALTSTTIGGRSIGIVRLQTKATEFVRFVCHWMLLK
jgi:hypothetical protein